MCRNSRQARTAACLFRSTALALFLGAANLAVSADPSFPLTLDDVRALAAERNPVLRTALLASLTAQGELKEADALLWHNPELSTEARDRKLASADLGRRRLRDGSVGISQTVETGGQAGYRRAAARDSLRATEVEAEVARTVALLEAERRFVAVLALQERALLARELLRGFDATAEAVSKRVRVGEDSRLDGNIAQVERERAASLATLQEVELLAARQSLAEWIQLPPPALPEAIGTLQAPSTAQAAGAPSPAGTLQGLSYRESEARNRLELERAARAPDVTLGINRSREKSLDGMDDITTLSISVPLPLFRKNDAAIGRAASAAFRARLAREAAERELTTRRTALQSRADRLAERVTRLEERALPALVDNERLSARAFLAGELALVQMVLVTRQLMEGRRELVDARWELRRTRIDLTAAAAGILEEASRPSATARANAQE